MRRTTKLGAVLAAGAMALGGCGVSPYDLPLPGGADLGDDPYEVTVEFRDVLDLVPQSAVRVDDIAVGKVTSIELDGWNATVTLMVNDEVELPDNAVANLRQSSLLGEKFVDLSAPSEPSSGELGEGDHIGLDRSGRNPDIEEVLGAASLLLNGGGLEKTNTIVKELSRTLDGNEPEIKQLLQNTENFLGQLDDNKTELLGALEQVNDLAKATQEQEDAIVSALDELPEALAVLDEQRDDIVALLESLDRLSDVSVDLIRNSKDDTLAVLRDLEPTLRGLADAGDDLATATQVLLTFPFTDEIVGKDLAVAQAPCPTAPPGGTGLYDSACYGDFANLDIRLAVDSDQLTNLIDGLLGSLGDLAGSAGSATDESSSDEAAPSEGETGEAAQPLVELVTGLVPAQEGEDDGSPDPSTPAPAPTTGTSDSGEGDGICGMLGLCRTVPASQYMDDADDVSRLVLGPAVAE